METTTIIVVLLAIAVVAKAASIAWKLGLKAVLRDIQRGGEW